MSFAHNYYTNTYRCTRITEIRFEFYLRCCLALIAADTHFVTNELLSAQLAFVQTPPNPEGKLYQNAHNTCRAKLHGEPPSNLIIYFD